MPPVVTIIGADHLPEEPALVIPNRVDSTALNILEETLGGMSKIAWLVEDTLRPSAELMHRVSRDGSSGILFSASNRDRHAVFKRISAMQAAGRHVVLLPGRPVQPPACIADVPLRVLRYLLEGYEGQVLPVYVGMYRKEGRAGLVTSAPPYERMIVEALSPFIPGDGTAERLMTAWHVAGANQVAAALPEEEETLGNALLRSLTEHPRAVIIDGVNEQKMSYRQLLTLAVPLARRLRKRTNIPRMGIILPPGRLSIVANVACILAGITPVNIDYNYTKRLFDSVVQQAELNRFISGSSFMQKLPKFPWPPSRDILLIEELLAVSGFSFQFIKERLVSRLGRRRLAAWMNAPVAAGQQEALTAFSLPEEDSGVRGTRLSHYAVLTGYRLAASRLELHPGQRTLSSLPFHYRAGLMLGLIYPLLSGQDIITYPEPYASKRICELARSYHPAIAAFEPRQIPGILAQAQKGDLADAKHILVAGRVPIAQAQQAYRDLKICLCECYMPAECAMPTACSIAPPEQPERGQAHALPGGAPGTVGLPMPGLAVKVTDILAPNTLLKAGEQGLLWVKGEPLFSGFAGEETAVQKNNAERWVCTGDIGYIRPDGLLTVGGTRERYSYVDGQLVSHAQVEEILATILLSQDEADEPRIAIVGIPVGNERAEQIVLLSTLHHAVGPHDVITLRYALVNARYPSHYAPQRIIALRAIPVLPGGAIDYDLCRRLALMAPGYRR